ncbi:MAG TPA: hypothetical protein VFE78_00530 [Gemmataceae bacterium]|nr:hypothetical protein [Gemmataceae bacterium]
MTHNVVVRRKPGLPARRNECWALVTDLCQSALRLTGALGRMKVEELFCDGRAGATGTGCAARSCAGRGGSTGCWW